MFIFVFGYPTLMTGKNYKLTTCDWSACNWAILIGWYFATRRRTSLAETQLLKMS